MASAEHNEIVSIGSPGLEEHEPAERDSKPTPSEPRLLPEIVDRIVEEVMGDLVYDKETGVFDLSKEEMRQLNTLVELGRDWVSRPRYLQAHCLLATSTERHLWRGLREILESPVPSSFIGVVSSFHLDMTEALDPPVHESLSVWRNPNHDIEIVERRAHKYIRVLGVPLSNGATVGHLIHKNTRALSLICPPYPLHLRQRELVVLTETFRHVTILRLQKSWTVKCFTDAVIVLQTLKSLEFLGLGELYVVEDDEEAAWKRLEDRRRCYLKHLKHATLWDVRSPYGMLALLEAGGPFASLRSFKWNFNGDYILHMAQETEAGELMRPGAYLRFSNLLHNLNVAHLEMNEGGSDAWNAIDLIYSSKMTVVGVFPPADVDVGTFLLTNLPAMSLKELYVSQLRRVESLRDVDAWLASLPQLTKVHCLVFDQSSVETWTEEVQWLMPYCWERKMVNIRLITPDEDVGTL
ncbi:hypothetical protein VNI00_000469 [Paramarasmius palmivorus]|uniref:Uncharacterized protein n=1 Tax=Paramarasmius palmivorus TaxID=297713 RepID=A0AAW0E901_9AGAR